MRKHLSGIIFHMACLSKETLCVFDKYLCTAPNPIKQISLGTGQDRSQLFCGEMLLPHIQKHEGEEFPKQQKVVLTVRPLADFLKGKRKCRKSAYMVSVSAKQYSEPTTGFIITGIGWSVAKRSSEISGNQCMGVFLFYDFLIC